MGVGCEIDSIRVLSIVYRIERVKPLFFRLLTRDLIFCTTFLGERERERNRQIERGTKRGRMRLRKQRERKGEKEKRVI